MIINIKQYDGPVVFGDEKLIKAMQSARKKNLETMRLTVNLSLLLRAGVEKNAALDLLQRLIEAKQK